MQATVQVWGNLTPSLTGTFSWLITLTKLRRWQAPKEFTWTDDFNKIAEERVCGK